MQAGVERYHADLLRGERTYYLPNGESEVVTRRCRRASPRRDDFSATGVDAAVRAIQAGRLQYRTFCERIAEAGCVGYMVSLAGQRAVYYGRTGDSHVEWFPEPSARRRREAKSAPRSVRWKRTLATGCASCRTRSRIRSALKLAARDITVAEWVVLRELYECNDMVPSVLAEKIGMTRGAISKLADRLSAKALVTRTTSDEDRRYQALALTAKGRAIVPKLAAMADQNDAEFFGHLKAAERESIKLPCARSSDRHGLKAVPVE